MTPLTKLALFVFAALFSGALFTTAVLCQPASELVSYSGPTSLRWESEAEPPSRPEARSFFTQTRALLVWQEALWVALPNSGDRLPDGGLVRLDPALGTIQARWSAPAQLPFSELAGLLPAPDDTQMAVVYRTGSRMSGALIAAIASEQGWVREPFELAGPAPVALLGMAWVDGAVELAVAGPRQGCNQATIVRFGATGPPASSPFEVAPAGSPAHGAFCAPDAAWRDRSGEWRFLVRRSAIDLDATGYWAVSTSGTDVVAEGFALDIFEDVDFSPLGRIQRLDGLAAVFTADGQALAAAPPTGAGREPALIDWRYLGSPGGLSRLSCWIESDETVIPALTGVSLVDPYEAERLLCQIGDSSLEITAASGGNQVEVRRWIDDGQVLVAPAIRIDAGCLDLSRTVAIPRDLGGYWLIDGLGCAVPLTI